MDALQEFIDELAQHDVDLASSLRKAKALTNSLHSPELDEWMDWELYGYTDPTTVPEYRRFAASNYGDFAGPGNFAGPNEGTPTILYIPTDTLPEEVKDFAENLIVLDAVGALQAHGAEDDKKPWPTDLVVKAQDATAIQGGLFLTSAYQYVEASVYAGILEQVRNRLFDFLLNLQSRGSASEESNQPEAVGRLVNYHIYGNHNVVATGEHVNQQVISIHKGDVGALLDHLRESGVGEEDIEDLRDAVSSEPEALPDGSYGTRVGGWLGGMLAKAATGVWGVGLETAAEVLPKALNDFYGI